eukprot:364935-Chlamydomonas_euryale.AAC.11
MLAAACIDEKVLNHRRGAAERTKQWLRGHTCSPNPYECSAPMASNHDGNEIGAFAGRSVSADADQSLRTDAGRHSCQWIK